MVSSTTARSALWAAVHAERAALADDLTDLDGDQWAQPSLCGRWVVEEVVAHLTAAASIGRLRWLSSAYANDLELEVALEAVTDNVNFASALALDGF